MKLLVKFSRINIEGQPLPNSMVSRTLYMHSQLCKLYAMENALGFKAQKVKKLKKIEVKVWRGVVFL